MERQLNMKPYSHSISIYLHKEMSNTLDAYVPTLLFL